MYRHREFEGGLGCRPPHVFLWRSGVNDDHISNFGRFGSGMVLVSQIEVFFAQYIYIYMSREVYFVFKHLVKYNSTKTHCFLMS